MARKKREYLKPEQRLSIQLALEGRNWKEVAEAVNVTEQTIWNWRQDPYYISELITAQENILQETALRFNTYISAGFATLYRIARNENKEYDQKVQAEAAAKLIELPMMSVQKLKLLEHNRRELKFEDAD